MTTLSGEIEIVADPMIRDVTDTATSELVRHAVAEEICVYPAMRRYLADGDNAVRHDIEEHKELERTMTQLEALDVSSAEFDDAIGKREALRADHVHDGESEQSPNLAVRCRPDELMQLAGKGRGAKEAPTHPATPERRPQQPTVPQARRRGGPGTPASGHTHRPRNPLSAKHSSMTYQLYRPQW